MKKDMRVVLEAAKHFLLTLPENSFVRVIDFDSAVRELKGNTVKEVVKSLSGIKAEGATKLYDATIRGIELVKGKTRPAVVVFTDGVDSREDKRGTGSTNSREQADKKIAEAEVPVFTIGFGKRLNADETLSTVDGAPDIGCLTSFASISCGQYYPAKDPEALPSVFTAIGSRLGNNFVLSYRRPVENNIGNTPVVSIVIDNSGSMNSDPKKPNAKDGNFRMEKTKQMVRDFVEKLPDKTVMQFTTFQGGGAMRVDVVRRQMSTVSKTNILKAIGEMNPVDGTPIVAALTSAYENLVTIPSQKKVIVFHTDSGLEMEQQYQAEYQKILSKIRDKGIFVLWIGMGITSPEKEKVFAEAAKATNGEYVISESVDEINRRLSALLERLQQPVATREVPLTIEIACQTKQGESLKFKAQNQAAFTPPEKAGTPLEPDIVTVEPGERIPAIDAQSAQNLGSAVISTVANNTRTVIDVCRTAENKAMQLTIKRMTYLDQLFGLDAGRNGMKFVAVDLELKNQTEKHIPYVIPSIFKHFYLGVNGKSLYPASKATWLVEKPITRHGDPSVRIPPDATVSGTLVFHVQSKNDGYEQQSLHFYDSDYGHIQVAVAGEIPSTWLDLAALPSGKPANLSDTFSFHPTAASLEPRISRYSSGDCALFRIVEGSFNSRVQALLNLDPARRIYLRYPTTAGDLLTTLSDVTRFTPLGFRDPVLLAPGSTNLVRFVYDVPSGLASFASELYFDLANGTAVFPVSSGTTYGSPANGTEIDGDLFKIRINELTQLQKPLTLSLDEGGLTRNVSKGSILLDVTFIDKPGNAGTIIPATFFSLVSKSYKSNTGAAAGRIGLGGASPGKDLVTVSKTNQGLIFGINDHFAVFEGQERRAIVVFDDPNSDISNWTLQSTFNGQVHVPIAKGEFHSPELLAWQSSCPSRPSEFAAMLEDAVGAAARMYARSSKDTPCDPTITLEKNDGYEQPIIPPIDLYGSQAMRGVTGEQAFFDLMRTIRCIPKHAHDDQPQNFDYAPESVVTQGFGDIGAVANLAMELLNRLGYSPRFEALEFTDAGARLLTEYYGIDIRREKSVPIGITYTNADRQRKTYVIPFMREMTELSGLVYRPHEAVWNDSPPRSHSVTVSVFAVYSPSGEGSAGATAGDAGSALGGGSGSKQTELRLLQKNLRLDRLSHDAIDLCFAPLIIRGKTAYRAMLFAPAETISAERLLENFKQITSIRIEISGINRGYSHTFDLAPDRKLEHVLMTIGINLPDLPRTASKALHDEFHLVRSTTKNPEPFTLVRLHNRQTLYRLIAGQTAFDHEFVHPGSLLLGRINRPRCIMVTSERNSDGSCTTWIDLLQPFNEIHAGDEGLRRSYNLLNGFFQSSLESKVFPADKRMGYLDVWRKAPKEAELLALPVCNNRGTLVTALEKSGTFPTRLLQAVKENKKVLFFPSKPTTIAGQNRFAWLEIDPVTFEVLSVFNNGCHGGSAEFSMLTTSLGEDTREFVKGAWIGVNVSVWSVAGVALKTQSTAQILTEAKALALKVGAMLAEFQDNVGKAKEFYDKIGELEEQADAAVEKMEGDGSDDSDDTDYGGKAKESFSKVFDQLPRAKIFGVSVNDKIKDGFRGFSNGYNTAVDSYFHFFSGTKKHVQVEPGGSK